MSKTIAGAVLMVIALILIGGGFGFYSTAQFDFRERYLHSNMRITANSTTHFKEISQFIYTSIGSDPESSYRTVRIHFLRNSSSACLLDLEMPFEVRNLSGHLAVSIIDELNYSKTLDSTSFAIVLSGSFSTLSFEWRIQNRVSFDEYRYLIPYLPYCSSCSVEKYIIEIYTLPGTYLDLGKTFPPPDNIVCRHHEYPRYRWFHTAPDKETLAFGEIDSLQATFSSPNKKSEKESLILYSGILVGLGTGILTELIALVAMEESIFHWTTGQLRRIIIKMKDLLDKLRREKETPRDDQ